MNILNDFIETLTIDRDFSKEDIGIAKKALCLFGDPLVIRTKDVSSGLEIRVEDLSRLRIMVNEELLFDKKVLMLQDPPEKKASFVSELSEVLEKCSAAGTKNIETMISYIADISKMAIKEIKQKG